MKKLILILLLTLITTNVVARPFARTPHNTTNSSSKQTEKKQHVYQSDLTQQLLNKYVSGYRIVDVIPFLGEYDLRKYIIVLEKNGQLYDYTLLLPTTLLEDECDTYQYASNPEDQKCIDRIQKQFNQLLK